MELDYYKVEGKLYLCDLIQLKTSMDDLGFLIEDTKIVNSLISLRKNPFYYNEFGRYVHFLESRCCFLYSYIYDKNCRNYLPLEKNLNELGNFMERNFNLK